MQNPLETSMTGFPLEPVPPMLVTPIAKKYGKGMVGINEPFEAPLEGIEQTIKERELALGITTHAERLLEASLLIDQRFLKAAIITGKDAKAERLFGDETWAGWLNARLALKEYGDQPLTVQLILSVHKALAEGIDPEIAGEWRNIAGRGRDHDEKGKPLTLTEDQLEEIERNQLLSFSHVSGNALQGFIWYPAGAGSSTTTEQIEGHVQELCHWYNEEKVLGQLFPWHLAATLQKKLISIHPFSDKSGTVSRLLMQWALENTGSGNSIIENPDDDLFTSDVKWVHQVQDGQERYKGIKAQMEIMQKAGVEDMAVLFNLDAKRTFYSYIFKHFQEAPKTNPGDHLSHAAHDTFLGALDKQFSHFTSRMNSQTSLRTLTGGFGQAIKVQDNKITLGGLVSRGYIDLVRKNPAFDNPYISRQYTHQGTTVYRGGMVEERIGDAELLRMFSKPTAVVSGYQALKAGYSQAMSIRELKGTHIAKGLERYNQLVAESYLARYHPKSSQDKNEDALKSAITGHTFKDSIWESPFVSTSINLDTASPWARKFHATARPHGMVIHSRLPKEGLILTDGTVAIPDLPGMLGLSSEHEILIAGAIHPSMIDEVEVYDRTISRHGLHARRVLLEQGEKIVVENQRGDYVVIRTYFLDPASQTFVLESSVQGKQIQKPKPQQELKPTGDTIPDIVSSWATPQEMYPAKIEELQKHNSYPQLLKHEIIYYMDNHKQKFSKFSKEEYLIKEEIFEKKYFK